MRRAVIASLAALSLWLVAPGIPAFGAPSPASPASPPGTAAPEAVAPESGPGTGTGARDVASDNTAGARRHDAAGPDNTATTPASPGFSADDVAPDGTEPAGATGAAPGVETALPEIGDPIEPVNRAVFVFNDKAYHWVMKPVALGYRAIVPEPARVSIRNFFSNVTTPVRLANNLLQGRFGGAGVEIARFAINTTVGIAGLFDPAGAWWGLARHDQDLGLTLGRYGLGHGLYIVLPLLGPSSLRDAVGLAGDAFLDPANYVDGLPVVAGIKAFRTENELSLSIGDYEELTKLSVDPYAAVRDAYSQSRAKRLAR